MRGERERWREQERDGEGETECKINDPNTGLTALP